MKFLEAAQLMKKGKKVKRKKWDYYWYFKSHFIYSTYKGNKGDDLANSLNYEATDWEIYDIGESLSDKIYLWDGKGDGIIRNSDVKEALKKYFKSQGGNDDKLEIFGEELL